MIFDRPQKAIGKGAGLSRPAQAICAGRGAGPRGGGRMCLLEKRSALLYLLPGLIGLTLFYIVPFVGGIYYSFTDGSYQNAFVWFDNYKSIWQNEMFLLGLKNTLLLSMICTPLVWLLSFGLAVLLNRLKPGGGVFPQQYPHAVSDALFCDASDLAGAVRLWRRGQSPGDGAGVLRAFHGWKARRCACRLCSCSCGKTWGLRSSFFWRRCSPFPSRCMSSRGWRARGSGGRPLPSRCP